MSLAIKIQEARVFLLHDELTKARTLPELLQKIALLEKEETKLQLMQKEKSREVSRG